MDLIGKLGGKKYTISLIGMAILSGMIFTNQDVETIKWFAGFVTGIVGTFNLAQGYADGKSGGATSS